MLQVVEATSEKALKDFITFPHHLYRNDPNYTPELTRDQKLHFSRKNPFFRYSRVRFFLAKADGKILGRVVSIINKRHIELHNEKAGFFGFYESVNDQSVANALLDRVAKELRKEGLELIRGPMNFSTNEQCGFLIEGYDSPAMLLMPYNPPYYHELMQTWGMKKAKDLLAFIKAVPEDLPEKIYRAAEIAERRGIRARRIDKSKLRAEMKAFQEIYNSAWKDNWGFIPFDDEELDYMVERLKPIIKPELTIIAEKDGYPVGFLGIFPDYNLVLRKMKGRLTPWSILKALYYHNKIEDLRLLLLGVRPEYRLRGVDALLFREAFRGARGYKRAEFSWILEDNLPVIRLVEMIGGRLYKRYRIYEKKL